LAQRYEEHISQRKNNTQYKYKNKKKGGSKKIRKKGLAKYTPLNTTTNKSNANAKNCSDI
jgi:hypothetical protein